MPTIPHKIAAAPYLYEDSEAGSLSTALGNRGYQLWHQGKVRNTHADPSKPSELVVVATDRLSIFDKVLPCTVPYKGEVLTALTHFWLTGPLINVRHHLIPSTVNPYWNASVDLERELGIPIAHRTLVVRRLEPQPYELIVRGYLGGSVWKTYCDTGIVAGTELIAGMKKWQKLNPPLFTPSTKDPEGDVNITQQQYFESLGQRGRDFKRTVRTIFERAHDFAAERGILLLDTKFEMDIRGCVIDEVLTPDSSRFTTIADWELAQQEGRDPIFLDKEPARTWGRDTETPFGTIDKLKANNPEHCAAIAALTVPPSVVSEMSQRYLTIFEKLVGVPLAKYQRDAMGVAR